LNELKIKRFIKIYLDSDGPLLLQNPSSFQFTQNSKPSNNLQTTNTIVKLQTTTSTINTTKIKIKVYLLQYGNMMKQK